METVRRINKYNNPNIYVDISPNASFLGIVNLNPIDISTLITSVVVALTTVYVTIRLNQWIEYNKSKKGLITEIKRNYSRILTFSTKVEGVIQFYSNIENIPRAQTIPSLILPHLENSSFNYFSMNGGFIKLPYEITENIEMLYELQESVTFFYNRDSEYQIQLGLQASGSAHYGTQKNRLIGLQNIQNQINSYQNVFNELKSFFEN